MSSSSRNVHQDFIAKIRFSNALPPPPNPPKLLDIPNTGLASGQYTGPSFATRLAREQPLNIEADAELGMPLDLVGMPGIFDGDESSISAPSQPPPLHPHDRALIKPFASLGKPSVSEASVSFLRRTEYISSTTAKHRPDAPLRGLNPNPVKRPLKRASPEPDKDSPAYVKRKIDQSFAISAQNLKDKSRVRHPSKGGVKLVNSYPLIPDLDAFPDSGAYVTIKLTSNPVLPSKSYDRRLLSSLYRPIEKSEEEEAAFAAAQQAYEIDPENNPKPSNAMNYELYLTDTPSSADKFRQRFDIDNPNRDDDSLYPHKGGVGPHFQFSKLRGYETAQETEMSHDTKYDEEVIIGFNDDASSGQKGVYYYPVMQRTTIKPQRTKNIARTIGVDVGEEKTVDQLDVKVDDPNDKVLAMVASFKDDPYQRQAEEQMDDEVEVHDEGEDHGANGRAEQHGDSEQEQDAEGDEDED